MYYFWIENNQINGKSDLYQSAVFTDARFQVEVTEQMYNEYEQDKYVYFGGEVILNPNWEEIKRQKEEERINNLTMTAQDLLEVIANSGATWAEIDGFLNSNPEFKLRLTTCQNVFCGVVKAFLPLKIGNITLTAEMVEQAFQIKNGEGVA